MPSPFDPFSHFLSFASQFPVVWDIVKDQDDKTALKFLEKASKRSFEHNTKQNQESKDGLLFLGNWFVFSWRGEKKASNMHEDPERKRKKIHTVVLDERLVAVSSLVVCLEVFPSTDKYVSMMWGNMQHAGFQRDTLLHYNPF